jgi:hypothetical protein
MICVSDLKLLEEHIEKLEDRIEREEAAKALAEIAREGAVPYEQVRRELGIEQQ